MLHVRIRNAKNLHSDFRITVEKRIQYSVAVCLLALTSFLPAVRCLLFSLWHWRCDGVNREIGKVSQRRQWLPDRERERERQRQRKWVKRTKNWLRLIFWPILWNWKCSYVWKVPTPTLCRGEKKNRFENSYSPSFESRRLTRNSWNNWTTWERIYGMNLGRR